MQPTTFAELDLRPELRSALAELGFERPTPVQSAALAVPAAKDLVVQAKTGSGKTLAFGLPIIQALAPGVRGPRALVLAPTRELATQIGKALVPLVRAVGARVATVTGGEDARPQVRALHGGAQVVVGTPGRVLDHIRSGALATKELETFVLDEGDRLLDMGFQEELEAIIAKLPAKRRTVLFSATVPGSVESLVRKHLRDPVRLAIDPAEAGAHADIEHVACAVPEGKKAEALANLFLYDHPPRTIVFCATRQDARELSERLPLLGLPAGLISGELEQEARTRALEAFRRGRCHVLVATDVAARGIDVPEVSHVIHFSLPSTAEDYVHRSGRTGRAGKKGQALTLVTARERGHFARLSRIVGFKVRWVELPRPEEIRRRQRERIARSLLEGLGATPSEEARATARDLLAALEGADPVETFARLLELAVEAEGEGGFDLGEAFRAEAARAARPSHPPRRGPPPRGPHGPRGQHGPRGPHGPRGQQHGPRGPHGRPPGKKPWHKDRPR